MRRVLAVIGATGLATAALAAATGSGAGAQAVEEPFSYAGASEEFVVPDGVCSITVEAIGASGGTGNDEATGGLGASATGQVAVTPGEQLTVVVGGAGQSPPVDADSAGIRGVGPAAGTQDNAGGSPDGGDGGDGGDGVGAGGGGSTALLRGGTTLVIAGGGGGGGGFVDESAGGAGGQTGEDGTDAPNGADGGQAGGNGGAGGAGNGGGDAGQPGDGELGGDGADGLDAGGGGGGGAAGGGGGGANDDGAAAGGGGGGGGSSSGPAGTVFTTGVAGDEDGNGVLVIAYDPAISTCPIVVEPRFTG